MAEEIAGWARALGAIPSGLFVVTAGVGETATGLLASWVQQVGFEPPAVSIAIKRGRHAAELVRERRAFCVSLLDAEAKPLLGHFARGFEPGLAAFDGIAIGHAASGVPFLQAALGHLECELIGEVEWSDHTIFCGRVVGGAMTRRAEPLIHIRKTGLSY